MNPFDDKKDLQKYCELLIKHKFLRSKIMYQIESAIVKLSFKSIDQVLLLDELYEISNVCREILKYAKEPRFVEFIKSDLSFFEQKIDEFLKNKEFKNKTIKN